MFGIPRKTYLEDWESQRGINSSQAEMNRLLSKQCKMLGNKVAELQKELRDIRKVQPQ